MAIKKAAVIGAGVMGAGIAAHLANAGYEVELLDRVDPKNTTNRTAIAEGAVEKLLKTSPAALMHKKNARKIRPGNTEDHMDRLKECDIIIEAVFEDPKVKSDIFKKIDAHRKPGSIVASNTSTIPLQSLIADQSDALKKDFVITHFFNPPRYMPLLELITSEHNDPKMVKELTTFLDEKLGKGVVYCNDTPGFIANRIGTFWIQASINEAISKKLTVEEADAIVGKPMGIPKTGIFGLVDLVGLDLMPHISKSLMGSLPADDGYVKANRSHPVIDNMIKEGYTGRKGKGGFYRRDAEKNDFAVDLETGALHPKTKVVAAPSFVSKATGAVTKVLSAPFKLFAKKKKDTAPKAEAIELEILNASKKGGLRALVEQDDKYGQYAWAVLKQTLVYAAEHAHTIAGSIHDVDQGMKLGYNWKYGPFELIDKMGVDYFIKRLEKDGEKVPELLKKAAGKTFYKDIDHKLNMLNKDGQYEEVKRPDGVLLLSDVKRDPKNLVATNKSASLWDIGDGVVCLEFHSKMNSIDTDIMKMMNKAADIIENGGKSDGKYKALVIHNEADDFSVGANIFKALLAAKVGQYWLIEKMVKEGQDTYKRLKYANFPVVSAPSGKALGGGCEVLLHSHHVQAHAETYPGLVEVGVGLLPAWGGSTELLTRAKQNKRMPGGPMPAVGTVFETISTAKVGLSAFEAKDLMYLRETDGVTMNKSRLLADAKKKALDLTHDFKPEVPFNMTLPGPSGHAAISMAVDGFFLKGQATPYDVVVSDKVSKVLTGGDQAGPNVIVTQDHLRALERKHFMELIHDKRTQARVETMLKTGKPLREKPIAGKRAQTLRDEADRPSFLARVVTNPIKGVFNKLTHKAVNDNTSALERDTKAKVNWPGTPKKPS